MSQANQKRLWPNNLSDEEFAKKAALLDGTAFILQLRKLPLSGTPCGESVSEYPASLTDSPEGAASENQTPEVPRTAIGKDTGKAVAYDAHSKATSRRGVQTKGVELNHF